jgi:mRNA-degrading endonuclease RelE of RelBE toxin-antitoxin system
VGNLRILFDIDDDMKRIEILDIRQRNERTYGR